MTQPYGSLPFGQDFSGGTTEPMVDLDQVKDYLHLATADEDADALLEWLIQAVSDFIQSSYCHRIFALMDYIELRSTPRGQKHLRLWQYPVESITSIHDDPLRAYGDETLIPAANYVLEDPSVGMIRLDGRSFQQGINNVQIIYRAGYDPVPADLQQAVIEIVARKFAGSDLKRLGVTGQSFEGGNITFSTDDILPEAKTVLDRYVKVDKT